MTESDRPRRVRVVVRGRVQGVAFRVHTAERARQLGAAGWVRNRADGSVEAVFEGQDAVVAAMLEFVAKGPRFARVDELEQHEEPCAGDTGFDLRY